MEQIKQKRETLSWGIYMGAMFVGMGVGMIFHQTFIGMMIGIGVGYIAEAIIESRPVKKTDINGIE